MPIAHKNTKGLIFNIQRFSIHDGPGIRTTVFMKGCPLRCHWCSNPESQDFTPNLIVRDINCRGCGACVEVCPEGAITFSRKEGRKLDWNKCNNCLQCVDSCHYNSLNSCGRYMTVDEVIDEIMKDEDFYRNSGGGVTISGGEALWQSRFVTTLLAECKQKGLHTVLDTTGYSSWEKMSRVVNFADLILFDIKHLDLFQHRKVTGVENPLILENLQKIAKMLPTWIRVPLIAGFNDSMDHIRQVALLGEQLGIEKISLLPYHEGGKSKSVQLGRAYTCSEMEAPTDEHVQKLKNMIEDHDISVLIGR